MSNLNRSSIEINNWWYHLDHFSGNSLAFLYWCEANNLITITRIMVFLYPAGSAFVNASILTNGKFPPIGWIKKVERFNKNLDIDQFKDKSNKSTNNYKNNDDEDFGNFTRE